MPIVSPMRGVPLTLHAALSASTANGVEFAPPNSFRRHKFNMKGSAGISSGAMQPESADVVGYSGTWNPIGGGPIAAVASSELEYEFEGLYSALRFRISTIIADGTITATYTGS